MPALKRQKKKKRIFIDYFMGNHTTHSVCVWGGFVYCRQILGTFLQLEAPHIYQGCLAVIPGRARGLLEQVWKIP